MSFQEFADQERQFAALSARHQALFPAWTDHLHSVRQCILENQKFLVEVIKSTDLFIQSKLAGSEISMKHVKSSYKNYDKVKSTLRQCMRDWSEEVYSLFD